MAEYLVRYFKDKPARPQLSNSNFLESLREQPEFSRPPLHPSVRLLLIGLSFESLFLYIR